jgi:hypothetical protein
MVVATLLLGSLGAGPLSAGEPHGPVPGSSDTAVVERRAGAGTHGRVAVNIAAGAGNAQANLAAIAFSDGGLAIPDARVLQRPQSGGREAHARARIERGAFGGGDGLLSLNQVAGSGNAQANVFVLGNVPLDLDATALPGAVPAPVGDAALAATQGDANPSDLQHVPAWRREAVIADDAFRGRQGVVQVNQTAGVGNNSANAIVIQLPGGSP